MLQNNIAIYEFFHYPLSYFSALKKEIRKEDYFKNTKCVWKDDQRLVSL